MSSTLYVDHVEECGVELFRMACEQDLEGVVAKWKHGRYTSQRELSSFIKIKNKNYSQNAGRDEAFERAAHKKLKLRAMRMWRSCEDAVAAVE